MAMVRIRFAAAAMCTALSVSSSASAQVFGTFSWQMQPYCNRVTLTLTSVTGNFTLDGFDDQCGATNKAGAVGVGTFNTGGDVTLNFTIVTAPSGKPVHVSAVVSPANGNGTWTDSVGNSGTLVLAGDVPGLPVRPLPASGIAPSTITATEIAAASVGSSEIGNGAVGRLKIAFGAVGAGQLGAINQRSTQSAAIADGDTGSATATCLAGEEVISGGNSNLSGVAVVASRRTDNGRGWVVFIRNDSGGNRTVTAHAYCVAP